jgi:hypothetical protein
MSHSATAVLKPQRVEPGIKNCGLVSSALLRFSSLRRTPFTTTCPTTQRRSALRGLDACLLVTHISGGIVALLVGPWQFSGALRRRYLRVHRLTGRIYLISVSIAYVAALCSGDAGWITGQTIVADGGASLMSPEVPLPFSVTNHKLERLGMGTKAVQNRE